MIPLNELKKLQGRQIDFPETEELIHEFAAVRQNRQPLFLHANEFEKVLQWKLDRQVGRQQKRRSANTDQIIQQVTQLAFSIHHEDKDYELELRIKILCAIRGVGVPVASAVLTLVFPEEYAVIDFRVWRQLFDEEKREFSVSDYTRYMKKIREIAKELNWPAQEVDHAIWEYDRRAGK